jgi:hypothetical protein
VFAKVVGKGAVVCASNQSIGRGLGIPASGPEDVIKGLSGKGAMK